MKSATPVYPPGVDPQGPDAYKYHNAGCVCPDCQASREQVLARGTVRGADVQAGQVIKSGHRWYEIVRFREETASGTLRTFDVTDTKGHPGLLNVFTDDNYPARVATS